MVGHRRNGQSSGSSGRAGGRDPFDWHLTLGRWQGLAVRVHLFFLLFAAATLYICWPDFSAGDPATLLRINMFWMTVIGFAILFFSVLVHELGHWLVARHFRVETDRIVLGPLGGLTSWGWSRCWRVNLLVAVAGPAANLCLSLVCLAVVITLDSGVEVAGLFHPLHPAWSVDSMFHPAQGWKLALWINWLLFLVNMLPAYPFDGERIVRWGVLQCRPGIDRHRLADLVFGLAVTTAAALMVGAIVLWKHDIDSPFPVWFALVLLSVVLLVSARRDVAEADEHPSAGQAGGEHAAGRVDPANALESASEAALAEWIEGRADADEATAGEGFDAEDDQQVDDLLSRVHESGIDSLTSAQRALLQRASARYRDRLDRRH